MKISKKRTVQVMVFAIALLLVLALSIGITGAWYQAKRQASGTVIMNQGIIIDYKGFSGNATATTWGKGVTLNLFAITDAQPGQNIAVNASSIKANADSVDFYARVKLDYKFYNVVKSTQEGVADTKTEVTLDDASKLITTSTKFFGDSWVKSQNNDGWFYYGTGTTLGQFTKSTDFVALFADGAKFVIEGANFVGADDGKGGGFVVNNTSINKIEVTLTLETLQGSANAKNEGWSITPIVRVDISGLTENKQIESIVPTITPTTEDVYITGAPAEKITITIGSKAFAGCPKLVLNLSDASNVTYIIASDAFESTAKVNYGSTNITSNIVNATNATTGLDGKELITGTQVYVYIPSDFTPDPTEPENTSYGTYQYTDDQGTWYYDLINADGTTLSASALSANTLAGSTNATAKIKYVDNKEELATLTIPQYIQSSAGSERYAVTVLQSYTSYSSIIKNKTNVQNVVIPYSVTSIESYAFYQCSGLTSITIPDSAESIGYYAFGYCYGLTSVTIPDSVTSIGSSAFRDCSGLTSITIPDSVTSMGSSYFFAFTGCSGLESITVAEGNTKYHSAGNCLIDTASKTLILGCKNSKIPTDGSVISIQVYAFEYCSNLTSITIPDSVTNIKNYAFYGCSGLTSITIPDSVTSIGDEAFDGCSGLTSITIPDSVTSIGDKAFSSCSGLTSITVASGNTKYHSAGNCLIDTNNKKLIAGCNTSVIPNDGSVTSIGNGAFWDCSGLISITIPDSVESIGYDAFRGCSGLKSVTIGSGVTAIPAYCFDCCLALETVVIKGAITSVEDYAFGSCHALTSVLFNKDSTVTVSISGLTQAEGYFNEAGVADEAGAYIKYSK